MSDDTNLGSSLGMGDSHTIRAKPFEFDRSKKVDAKIADAVWDIIQGKVDPTKIIEPDADGMVSVPVEYVRAVAWWIIRMLKKKGCGKGFYVTVLNDEPVVTIEYKREFEGILNADGDVLSTRKRDRILCDKAFVMEIDPEWLGNNAAAKFVEELSVM